MSDSAAGRGPFLVRRLAAGWLFLRAGAAAGGSVADEFEVGAADGPDLADASGGESAFLDEYVDARDADAEFGPRFGSREEVVRGCFFLRHRD